MAFCLQRTSSNRVTMLRNYLLSTLRNIIKRKGFSTLNILGLSIGVACALLILQYVKDELSYDDFHEHAEDIYRVQYDFYRDGAKVFECATAFPKVGPAMKADFPEVENTCRMFLRYGGGVVRYGDVSIKEDNLFTAEQSFFDLFSYELLAGNRATALKEPNTAVIEEETAKKYFGSEDPLGKRIRFGDNEEYEITGVIRSPENSHLKFTFLFSYPTLTRIIGKDFEEAWGWYDFYNYVQLKPGSDPKALEAKLPEFVRKYGGEHEKGQTVFRLQHLPDIHLYSNLIQEARVNGNGRSVYFLMVIAFIILLIAWVNYVNLATARATERAKEVGVRKSIGAGRMQVMMQFLSESFAVNFISVILSIVLLALAIPFFNSLAGKNLTTSILTDIHLWYAIVGFFIVGSLLSGLYPAFVLASFHPVKVLKGAVKGSREGLFLRKGLVIIQFAASVGLIAGTMIVYQQLTFMQQRDLGIDIEQSLVVNAPGVAYDSLYPSQLSAFRNEILRHPSITKMTASTEIPGNLIYWTNGAKRIGVDQEQASTIMYRMGIDYDFFAAYGNKFIAGRGYHPSYTADSASVVLNKKAIDVLGFASAEEAVGGKIKIGRDTLTIIGVIENYHQEGLKNDFRQTAFSYVGSPRSYFTLKVNSKDLPQTLAFAKEKFALAFPGNPFDYFFLDNFFERQYQQEHQFGKVFTFFAILAIGVASLGLFGLASFTAAQRTKEIGIRKVLGSSVTSIFFLLSRDFMKLVIIGNLIAIPFIWWLMDSWWLNQFAFRISIGAWIFVAATLITTAIALFTVSYQSISAATANPVKSLRYE
jgi:putative ABC transport system permease protein